MWMATFWNCFILCTLVGHAQLGSTSTVHSYIIEDQTTLNRQFKLLRLLFHLLKDKWTGMHVGEGTEEGRRKEEPCRRREVNISLIKVPRLGPDPRSRTLSSLEEHVLSRGQLSHELKAEPFI